MPSGENLGGPGASASSIKAGGAFFEITGKDGASKVIAQVQSKLAGFEKSLKKAGGIAGVGGFLGGMLGGSSLTGALMQFGSGLGKELMDAALNAGELRMELEKSVKLAGELQTLLKGRFSREDEELNDPANKGMRLSLTRELLERETTEQDALSRNLGRIRKELKDMAGEDLETTNWNPANWFGEAAFNKLKTDLADVEARYKATKERVAKHAKDMEKMTREADRAREERESRDFFSTRGMSPLVSAIRPGLEPALKAMKERFWERSGKDFFDDRGLNPIASALRPLLKDPEAMRDLRERTIERNANIGGGGALRGIAGLLSVGMAALSKQGPMMELATAAREIRGGFGGQNAAQRFGFGENVMELSLKAQQQIAANTTPDTVGKAVGDALAVKFAMR